VRNIPELEPDARKIYARKETWRATIELQPIPGPNHYPDRWSLKRFDLQRQDRP
jgi:hypothetical protein